MLLMLYALDTGDAMKGISTSCDLRVNPEDRLQERCHLIIGR